MFPPMMPMGMGPMMPGMPGTPLTVEQQRAALEAQQQEMKRLIEAAELALKQIDEELGRLASPADEADADTQRTLQVEADASQLRATVQAQQTKVDIQQARTDIQQARLDRAQLSNELRMVDRRQWVAGGEEFGRPVL